MLDVLIIAVSVVISLIFIGLYTSGCIAMGFAIATYRLKWLRHKPVIPVMKVNQEKQGEFLREWMLANPSFSREDYLGVPKATNVPGFQVDVKRGSPKT